MLDEITLESLTKEQFECFIKYYRENYLEDYKSDLENLKEVYKMINGRVEYPRTQNASPSEITEPYEPSPRMYSYEQPLCLGLTFIGETLRKSDQLHTRKLDDMIELPKSQPKKTYNEDLECEIVMVNMPKCMTWLDDEPIADLSENYTLIGSVPDRVKFHELIIVTIKPVFVSQAENLPYLLEADSYDEKAKENEEEEKDIPKNIHVNPSTPPDP
nr:hypothetical protein [Tanacetum cinerariifolium]